MDGKRPAGPNQVRESLADKSDGDTTVFTVIHEGKTVDRTVTLEAWDSERMKAATVIGAVGFATPAGEIHLPHDFKFERVFDRFYRLDQSRAAGTGGSGLGLAICREVLAVLRGSIRIAASSHEGTTFEIGLPGRVASSRRISEPLVEPTAAYREAPGTLPCI